MIFWLLALFVSITVHEFMHAWSANYLGDPTAKAMGRASLNPIVHIDPIGTVLLPLFLSFVGAPVFGWAKPVQINPNNFKDYKVGQALTAIAGPIGNLILIVLFSAIFYLLPEKNLFGLFVVTVVSINLILMIFNLLPIPPLDGSKVLYRFISHEAAAKLEQYGIFILFAFIFFFGGRVILPALAFLLDLLNIPTVGVYISTYL
ncbi:site-2 protease family protein [Patescibacteria group bacterium]|nr:site-2 protease family protein [Patescibacteria group bacterium]